MSEHREYTLPTPIDSEDEKLDNETMNETSEQVEKTISDFVENNIPFQVNVALNSEMNGSTEELLSEMKEPMVSEENLQKAVVDDVKTLAMILKMVLNSSDSLDKYSLVISPDIKNILAQLLEHDTYFDDYEFALKEIIKDGKIDANDVPRIMILLSDLYVRLRTMNVDFDENTCGQILQVIFNIALKEGLIKINIDEELALLQCLYNIVETSIRLIKIGNNPIKRSGLFDCLCKPFFGGK
jgi:hypothetical protein